MKSIMDSRLSQGTGPFGFSIDQKATVNALRALADALERNEAILTKATQYRVAHQDNYEVSGVVLHFTEANSARAVTIDGKTEHEQRVLRGAGHVFPVDATRPSGAEIE